MRKRGSELTTADRLGQICANKIYRGSKLTLLGNLPSRDWGQRLVQSSARPIRNRRHD
jgi:hypothetical protein